MRFIVALGLLGLLAACATSPFTKEMTPHPQPELQEQEAFIAALDQFSTSNKLERMLAFQQNFPNSSLAAYAETISLYAEELDVRKAQVEALQQAQQELQLELEAGQLELEAVQQKNQQLKEENLQLDEKIEQLKKLLIELEQRSQ